MSEATLAELEHVLHRQAIQRYFTHTTITPAAFLADLRVQADLVILVPWRCLSGDDDEEGLRPNSRRHERSLGPEKD